MAKINVQLGAMGGGGAGGYTWRGAWADATEYSQWDQVTNDGDLFICTVAHTSAAVTEPGTGAQWATVWARQSDMLTADEIAGIEGSTPVLTGANPAVSEGHAKLKGDLVTLTDAANIAVDLSTGNNFTVTLGGDRTLSNPTNATVGQTGLIFIVQPAAGGKTLAFSSYYKFPSGVDPTVSAGADAVDALCYFVRSSTFLVCELIPNLG